MVIRSCTAGYLSRLASCCEDEESAYFAAMLNTWLGDFHSFSTVAGNISPHGLTVCTTSTDRELEIDPDK